MSETPDVAPPVDHSEDDWAAFREWKSMQDNKPADTPAETETAEAVEDDGTNWIVGHNGERVKVSDYDPEADFADWFENKRAR